MLSLLGPARNDEIKMPKELTAIVESEGDRCVAFCPGVDVASQGDAVAEPRANL